MATATACHTKTTTVATARAALMTAVRSVPGGGRHSFGSANGVSASTGIGAPHRSARPQGDGAHRLGVGGGQQEWAVHNLISFRFRLRFVAPERFSASSIGQPGWLPRPSPSGAATRPPARSAHRLM
jgi:hypothetical protein